MSISLIPLIAIRYRTIRICGIRISAQNGI